MEKTKFNYMENFREAQDYIEVSQNLKEQK